MLDRLVWPDTLALQIVHVTVLSFRYASALEVSIHGSFSMSLFQRCS